MMLLLAVLCVAPPASADVTDVTIQISGRETTVGVPITLRIAIENADVYGEPVMPEVSDLQIRLVGGPSRSSHTSWVNGRVDQKVTISYDYHVTPTRPGVFRIPPIEVEADGRTFQTQPIEIVATKSETDTDNGDLLFVDIVADRSSLYVGEPLNATLQIWVRPKTYDDRGRRAKLSDGDMWSCIDLQNSTWGPFGEVLQEMLERRRRPSGDKRLREDSEGVKREYYVYELTREIWPQSSGPLDVGEIRVRIAYPTRIARDNSLFALMGELAVTQRRTIEAGVEDVAVEVKPIPTVGRPPYYEGAVGRYEISASAEPAEVGVGEPITLTLVVAGRGHLETLQPPPLPQIEALTRGFKVPTDPLAGEIVGGRKRFVQSIRAKDDQVSEIPPIPFAYFDPQLEQFETVFTQALPIRVKPAEKLAVSQIVDASGGRTVTQSLTELTGGIVANYTDAREVLRQQSFAPGWLAAAAIGLPPLLFGVSCVVQWRRDRLRNDQGFARRRGAKRAALCAIDAAATGQAASAPTAVAAALAGYVADRCNLPPGGLTRAEVVRELSQRRVSESIVGEVDRLLECCETLQYAPAGESTGDELADAARRCVRGLAKERF